MVGKTLGHYEILEPLGAGGMGEVYRARDTKLERDVAIKVLPEDFATDPEQRARFEREAKLLASLNHANIAAIYGLEDEGDQRFIVMEVVEGETLAERIARSGRIEVEEALEIARQIAEALEAAHTEHIIHRDLKPANVLVERRGQVKVCDFGIGKRMEVSADLTATAEERNLTVTGTLVGTPAYMSPEHIRGEAIDKRVDIWAFGCLLFQTLTGRSAFGRETLADTLAAIVDQEPDWGCLPEDAPPVAGLLLRRCLRKDPNRRLRDIGDARIEIADALSGDTDARSAMLAAPATSPAAPLRRGALPWSIAVIAILALFAAVVLPGRDDPLPAADPVRFTLEMPERASFSHSGSLAISPDGSRIVFTVGRGPTGRLHVRHIGELEAEPIRGTEGGVVPFFSADGAWLGFHADGQLKKVPVGGGVPETIVGKAQFMGASWGDQGNVVYAESFYSPVWIVDADGGVPQQLTTLEPDELGHWWPQLLPGDRAVLFTNYAPVPKIEAFSLGTGERRLLVGNGAFARYVPTGHLLFVRDRALMAAPFDPDRLEVLGSAVPVVEDVALNRTEAGSQYAISDTGSLVYLTATMGDPPKSLASVDRNGRAELLGEPDLYHMPRVSADGRRLAVAIRDSDNDIWILDLQRGSRSKVTKETGGEMAPVWTPDGTELMFAYEGTPNFTIARTAADGSGDLEPLQGLGEHQVDAVPSSLARDGEILAYAVVEIESQDIWTVGLDGESEPKPFLATESGEEVPAFSPDGRWIAYQSNESGRFEVYVLPYPEQGPRITVSTEGGVEPVWSPDGRELFYRPLDENGLMSAKVVATESQLFDVPKRLFDGHYDRHRFSTPSLRNYDVMPDGEHFIMIRPADTSRPRMHVVLNWFEELQQRVPTGGAQ